jgi:hypothetical protein
MPLADWQPPGFCLTGLTALVTLVAGVALVFTTMQLASYASVHGTLHLGMIGILVLYAAVAVTGVKSLLEWRR